MSPVARHRNRIPRARGIPPALQSPTSLSDIFPVRRRSPTQLGIGCGRIIQQPQKQIAISVRQDALLILRNDLFRTFRQGRQHKLCQRLIAQSRSLLNQFFGLRPESDFQACSVQGESPKPPWLQLSVPHCTAQRHTAPGHPPFRDMKRPSATIASKSRPTLDWRISCWVSRIVRSHQPTKTRGPPPCQYHP